MGQRRGVIIQRPQQRCLVRSCCRSLRRRFQRRFLGLGGFNTARSHRPTSCLCHCSIAAPSRALDVPSGIRARTQEQRRGSLSARRCSFCCHVTCQSLAAGQPPLQGPRARCCSQLWRVCRGQPAPRHAEDGIFIPGSGCAASRLSAAAPLARAVYRLARPGMAATHHSACVGLQRAARPSSRS